MGGTSECQKWAVGACTSVAMIDIRASSAMNPATEAGSYLRLIDSCITQLKAQGPSRTCNESKEEEEEASVAMIDMRASSAMNPAMHYRVASLIRNHHPLGPHSRPVPRAL